MRTTMNANNIYGFQASSLNGTAIDLAHYRGKVLLIVNTASQCMFTSQYKALEEVHRHLHDKGLEVLGFPCDQFGNQEPGNEEEIGEFCERNYGVTFPLFAKIHVNGEHAHPLFNYLKHAAPGLLGSEMIKWNFTKFLVKKDGTVYKRYAPQTNPQSLISDIDKLLAE
ncbi:glutathione peroxidase [Herminiimonas aquatilis]|uniref:Glutathione peroxidase n=1 Tax=Herminiimonas aquatilis TaxID=345342 RepID=A0ABW2J3M5_9BURK